MRSRVFFALLALGWIPAAARAGSVGIGAFGGVSLPILNDTAGNGSQYGVRVPVHVVPYFGVEPYFAQSSLGSTDQTFAGLSYTRSGPDVTTWGANAIFYFGGPVQFYPLVGIGSTTIQQTSSADVTGTNINFGLGFGFTPLPKTTIDLRGEMNSVITGSTSRKFGNITAGVSYALFGVP
jgi:hypothetical protein